MNRIEIIELDYFLDNRGWLLKVLMKEHMGSAPFGEIYTTLSNPGITRAEHYHKKTNEWFCVIQGTGKLVLEDMATKERKEIVMGGEKFLTVKIPSGIAHAIKNVGPEEMVLLAIADRPYDPKNPDTFPYSMNV